MTLIPDETCPSANHVRSCLSVEAIAAGVHCDHWYEDEGCCACGTNEPNLVIIEGAT